MDLYDSNNGFTINIKTMPNMEKIDMLPKPELSLGGVFDSYSIEKKMNEAKQNQIDYMSLNPLYGKICCIGLYENETKDCIKIKLGYSEKEMIEQFFEKIFSLCFNKKIMISWNGINFVLPFIYKRALILGIKLVYKPMSFYTRLNSSLWPHCDMMQVWSNRGYDYANLENVASVLLGENKLNIAAKDIPNLIKSDEGKNKIIKCCYKDCEIIYKIYKMCKGFLFA